MLGENDPTSHFIYEPSKQFLNEFMVSISSSKSSSTQHDVHFVNYGPIGWYPPQLHLSRPPKNKNIAVG